MEKSNSEDTLTDSHFEKRLNDGHDLRFLTNLIKRYSEWKDMIRVQGKDPDKILKKFVDRRRELLKGMPSVPEMHDIKKRTFKHDTPFSREVLIDLIYICQRDLQALGEEGGNDIQSVL